LHDQLPHVFCFVLYSPYPCWGSEFVP
jgi:hypothetical protein